MTTTWKIFHKSNQSLRALFFWRVNGIWTFTFHKKSSCVEGDLKGQFQTTGHNHELFYLKIQTYHIHFPFIFCCNCQIQCFFHTLLPAISNGWSIWIIFLHQITTQIFQLIGTAVIMCKKQWIWQFLQKIEGKWI